MYVVVIYAMIVVRRHQSPLSLSAPIHHYMEHRLTKLDIPVICQQHICRLNISVNLSLVVQVCQPQE